MVDVFQEQVGGDHYKKYEIQPLTFSEQIGLSPMVFCAYKYLCRYKDKNGMEDLNKAIHCVRIFQKKGVVKKLWVGEKRLNEFLAQFEQEQAKALKLVIEMQAHRTLSKQLLVQIDVLKRGLSKND